MSKIKRVKKAKSELRTKSQIIKIKQQKRKVEIRNMSKHKKQAFAEKVKAKKGKK